MRLPKLLRPAGPRRLVGVVLLALNPACQPGEAPHDSDTDVVAPSLPVVTCGTAGWSRLPGPLGVLVDDAPRPDLSFGAPILDLLLAESGLSTLAPTPQGVTVRQIRYTTQDRGLAVEATGLVAIPEGAGEREPWPVVLMLHSFAGLQGACAPSAGRLEEAIEPVLVASRGFVVIAPDFIGLDGSVAPPLPHAPLVAEQVAVGAWDALRAGRALLARPEMTPPPGLRDDVVVWGYSQGGQGALVTERFGAYLAPDVRVAAVIAGVPPLDSVSAIQHAVDGWSDSTALSAIILAGMYRWYQPEQPLSTVLANGAPTFLADTVAAALSQPAETCGEGFDPDVGSVEELYAASFVSAATAGDWEAVPPYGCFLAEASLPSMSVPPIRWTPTLLVFGTADTVVDTSSQVAGVGALCDAGAPFRTLTCEGGDHAFAALWSIPEQVQFVRDRLDGVALEGLCAPPLAPVHCAAETP